jgi:hypothetical protein
MVKACGVAVAMLQGHSWAPTAIYTYPSKKSMASIKDKVRTLTRRAKQRARQEDARHWEHDRRPISPRP